MARNSGKKFNATLQETMEHEGMIRQLKEANLYDHNDTYEARKQLFAVLQQSKEDARRIQISDQEKDSEKNQRSEKKIGSCDDEFNIVDDDDDLKEILKVTSSSTQISGKKQPAWKTLSDDEDETPQTKGKTDSASRVATKPFQKNTLKLHKAKPSSIDSKKLVQTPAESYGNKMVAASIKKSEDNPSSPNSSRLLNSRRGDLIISPDEVTEILNDKKSDTEDDDFASDPPSRSKENTSRAKTEQSNPGQKQKFAAMKALCKKYSEMLTQIENVSAFPLPENPNFDSKEACCKLLIENEERLKASQSSDYDKPMKWRKPIILSATNSKKRRPIFNQPSTSRTTPPKDAQEDSVDAVEIVCDSPPVAAAAFTKKLDISPPSPILESSASRKRSGGSNGITEAEMEVDRKSPIDMKEDSATQECPICGKLFPLSVIEGHADGCINTMEERPRSERIARNARSNKSYNTWSDNSQWGRGFDRTAGTSTVSETIDPDVLFETDGSQPDSDFEPDPEYDPGTKRSQRKTESAGVKKRRM